MKTRSECLNIIQAYFSQIGINIVVIPLENWEPGYIGPNFDKYLPEWRCKLDNHQTLMITCETPLSYVIHESIHLLFARKAWDFKKNSDTYNWADNKTKTCLGMEDVYYVVFGRYLAEQILDIQDEIIHYDYHITPIGHKIPKCNSIMIDYHLPDSLNKDAMLFFAYTGVYVYNQISFFNVSEMRDNLYRIRKIHAIFSSIGEEFLGLESMV